MIREHAVEVLWDLRLDEAYRAIEAAIDCHHHPDHSAQAHMSKIFDKLTTLRDKAGSTRRMIAPEG